TSSASASRTRTSRWSSPVRSRWTARTPRTTATCWSPSASRASRGRPAQYTSSTARRHAMVTHIGLVGLGKMGANMRSRLRAGGIEVTGFDRNPDVSDVSTLAELVEALPAGQRVVWVMVPSGPITRGVVTELGELLTSGDVVVEGGNSHFSDDAEHAAQL